MNGIGDCLFFISYCRIEQLTNDKTLEIPHYLRNDRLILCVKRKGKTALPFSPFVSHPPARLVIQSEAMNLFLLPICYSTFPLVPLWQNSI